ncbi:hypothetical protein IAT38_007738 [Cryptococcus sp. DSM 104549]
MAYPPHSPLPSLSAALANGAGNHIAIAPELMGEDGAPPHIPGRDQPTSDAADDAQDAPSQTFANYQSSSARDEGYRAWGSDAGRPGHAPVRAPGPWEEGYRSLSHAQEQQRAYVEQPVASSSTAGGAGGGPGGSAEGDDEPPKPRKRARPTKPRESRDRNGSVAYGLPEEGVLDYAHPSGDHKLGPVFVHPPQGAAQACVRCHKIKRKCDNARPRCAGCSKADVACVFELNPATASYVANLKEDNVTLQTQYSSATDRVQQLEALLISEGRELPPQPEPTIRQVLQHAPGAAASDPELDPAVAYAGAAGTSDEHRADFATLARSVLAVRSDQLANPVFGPTSVDVLTAHRRPTAHSADPTSAPSHVASGGAYPKYALAMEAVETFFVCNAISHPFIDRDDFTRDMEELYQKSSKGASRGLGQWAGKGDGEAEAEARAGKEFVFFMVLAIGTTNRERMGEVPRGSSIEYRNRALQGLYAAVGKEDFLCIQCLLLLVLYAMFDPSGISLWHVLGFAARVAISLNLHRRVDGAILPQEVVEQRRRLFYSLYNLDRMISVTLSKPLAIADNDIDVELPTHLPSDVPFRGRDFIDYTRHIIKLRRLTGVVLSAVYSVSGDQNSLPEPERAHIIMDLHSRFDQWLADCPSPDDNEEKRGSITNHSWFLLQYHQGLCLLYRPSPLYPVMTPERLSALHEASTRCVDLYMDLWHDRKVSYNLINVAMQFLACISFLYCLCEYDNRDPQLVLNPEWRADVSQKVGQCQELLEAFGQAVPETRKYREIFTQLSQILLARHEPAAVEAAANAKPAAATLGKHPREAADASSSVPGQQPSTEIPPATGLDGTLPETLASATQATGEPDAGTPAQAQTPGESAWNVMTQLWHNSGDFLSGGEVAGDGPSGAASGAEGAEAAANLLAGMAAASGNASAGAGAATDGGAAGQGEGQGPAYYDLATALSSEERLGQGLWN